MKVLFGLCLLLVPLCCGNAQHFWGNQSPGYTHRTMEHTKGALQTYLGHILGNLDFNWHETILSSANVSHRCGEDIFKLRQDLLQMKNYALHMLDACGKPPSGILTGNVQWPGSYAQCTNVTRQHHNITFDGKYFMAGMKLVDETNQTRLSLKLGMCVPSTCCEDDVIQVVRSSLSFLSFIHWRVKHVNVFTPEAAPIRAGTVTAICICGVLCILLLLGTLYDVMIDRPRKAAGTDEKPLQTNDEGLPSTNVAVQPQGITGRVLLSFSIYNNVGTLLSTTQSADSIRCLHGIRVISMSWIILGHTVFFLVGALDNPVAFFDKIKTFAYQAVIASTFAVDTFFVLSGLLMTYHLMKRVQKTTEGGKSMCFVMLYILRYCRLTPILLFVIMMATWTMSQLFTGPLWNPNVSDVYDCWTNWWTNILYINNLVHMDNRCLGWTWYLANDMQFFIIGVPIVYALYRTWYIGWLLKLLLLAANFVAAAMVAAKYGVRADYLRTEGFSMKKIEEFFTNFYIKPWVRISPYLIGMAIGWLLFKTREMHVRKKLDGKTILWIVAVGWCTAAASALALVYGLYGTYNGAVLTHSVNLFYLTVHSAVWAMAVAWVVVACHHGYGGIVNTILSWNVWVPLSRLTYSAYLIHPLVMVVTYHTAEAPLHHTTLTMIYLYLGHLVLAYGLAVTMFVAVESPMASLLKTIFEKRQTNDHRRLSD